MPLNRVYYNFPEGYDVSSHFCRASLRLSKLCVCSLSMTLLLRSLHRADDEDNFYVCRCPVECGCDNELRQLSTPILVTVQRNGDGYRKPYKF